MFSELWLIVLQDDFLDNSRNLGAYTERRSQQPRTGSRPRPAHSMYGIWPRVEQNETVKLSGKP
jgi:hypothetical protein